MKTTRYWRSTTSTRLVRYTCWSSRSVTSPPWQTATEADAPVLGRILAIANRLATEHGSSDGFRLIINTGPIGHQEVQHLHAHIVGGPEPVGPMLKRV
jgi:diadenosine tetraphosphate (Ap4A) HIT family hydrolase